MVVLIKVIKIVDKKLFVNSLWFVFFFLFILIMFWFIFLWRLFFVDVNDCFLVCLIVDFVDVRIVLFNIKE